MRFESRNLPMYEADSNVKKLRNADDHEFDQDKESRPSAEDYEQNRNGRQQDSFRTEMQSTNMYTLTCNVPRTFVSRVTLTFFAE